MAGDNKGGTTDYDKKIGSLQAQMAKYSQSQRDAWDAGQMGSSGEDGYSGENGYGDYKGLQNQIATLNNEKGEASRVQALDSQGKNADGSFKRPEWQSLIDPDTGLLKKEYVVGAGYKPPELDTAGLSKFREQALRDPGQNSAWAALQLQKQQQEQQTAQSQAAAQSNSGNAAMFDQLAGQGGASSGSRERMAQSSLRDMMRNSQGINNQGMSQRLGINTQDESNRIQGLKDLQGLEMQKSQYQQNNDQAMLKLQDENVHNALNEQNLKRGADMDKWKTDQSTWAANKQADAQKNSTGGGGCCFIFLEARYGNGTMDSVVRRFRDENMTARNQRGYYKLSEVLVPLMRKSLIIKTLVRVTLTSPLVSYGKYHYGEGKIGVIFAPLKNMWLKVFNTLGDDVEFIRENGETV